jgi:hypothetical protein
LTLRRIPDFRIFTFLDNYLVQWAESSKKNPYKRKPTKLWNYFNKRNFRIDGLGFATVFNISVEKPVDSYYPNIAELYELSVDVVTLELRSLGKVVYRPPSIGIDRNRCH